MPRLCPGCSGLLIILLQTSTPWFFVISFYFLLGSHVSRDLLLAFCTHPLTSTFRHPDSATHHVCTPRSLPPFDPSVVSLDFEVYAHGIAIEGFHKVFRDHGQVVSSSLPLIPPFGKGPGGLFRVHFSHRPLLNWLVPCGFVYRD